MATTVQIRSTVSQLLTGLSATLPFIDRAAKFPLLHHARLDVTPQGATVEATDLRVGYLGPIDVEGKGTVLVPARQLVELLKNCEPEAPILLSQTRAGMLRVLIGSDGRYLLRSALTEEFPVRRDDTAEAVQIPIRASRVAAALRGVIFAMNKDMMRPALAGVELMGHGAQIEATATDGAALAHATLPSDPVPDFTVFVPGDAVPQVLAWLESLADDEAVVIGLEKAFLTMTQAQTTITVRLTDATFVEWRQLVPESVPYCLPMDRAELLQSLRRGYALRSDRYCATRLTSQQGSLLIETLGMEGDILAQELVPCEGAEPGAHALLKTTQVLDALQTIAPGEGTVYIGIQSATTACVLYGQDMWASFALIMPLRDASPGVWEGEAHAVRQSAQAPETVEEVAL